MKHLILSFLLLCGTMSFAATPQQYEVAIDDSIQPIVEAEMKSRLQTTEAEWGCAILMNKDHQVVALYDTDSLGRNAYQPIEIGCECRKCVKITKYSAKNV